MTPSELFEQHKADERKFGDPTPEDLGLPSDTRELWKLEYQCDAPRAAWQAYNLARGAFYEEANAKAMAKEKARELRRGDRLRVAKTPRATL